MDMMERSKRRRECMQVHKAGSFEEAELWDLEFWQSQTPAMRLSALVAIRKDIEKVPQPKDRTGDQNRGTENPGT